MILLLYSFTAYFRLFSSLQINSEKSGFQNEINSKVKGSEGTFQNKTKSIYVNKSKKNKYITTGFNTVELLFITTKIYRLIPSQKQNENNASFVKYENIVGYIYRPALEQQFTHNLISLDGVIYNSV